MKNLEKFWKVTHPRNVVIVGSGNVEENIVNFMPASWNVPLSEDVPSFGIVVDKETYTFELIEKYKEFSINILDFSKIDEIFFMGSVSGRNVNKIEKLNLKFSKGKKINGPILTDSLAFFECKIINFLDVGEIRFYVGKVLNCEYEKEVYDEHNGFDLKKVNLVYHLKGNVFVTVNKIDFAKKI